MAIIIPSRSIYKIQNPKVRDNLVDKVEVAVTEITPNNEYETPVYNEAISIDYSLTTTKSNSNKKDFVATPSTSSNGTITGFFYSCAYLDNDVKYFNTKITIPRYKDNKFINKLYKGEEEQNGEKKPKDVLSYSLEGRYTTQNVSSSVTSKLNESFGNNSSMSQIVFSGTQSQKDGILNLPDLPIIVEEINPSISPNLKAKVVGLSNESSYTINNYSDEDKNITINVYILCYIKSVSLKGKTSSTATAQTTTIPLEGIYEEYKAEQITFTAYGNTIGIDLTDKTKTIGEGNKPLSFDGNELMQTTNRLNTAINGKTEAVEGFYTSTLNAFKNGKETATIRCSIGEYKDQSGNVAISPNGDKRIFKVGDEVIPMVYTNVGDKAMSNYKDGNDKVFKVLATNIHAQGVAWQDLTLQEK